MKVYINNQVHMTKMAAKTFKIFFSRTRRPKILKSGMKHQYRGGGGCGSTKFI